MTDHERILGVPEGLDFAELNLKRSMPDGGLDFDRGPLQRLCDANGLNWDTLDEVQAVQIVAQWYIVHLKEGGTPNAAAQWLVEQLKMRTTVLDEQRITLKPTRAERRRMERENKKRKN